MQTIDLTIDTPEWALPLLPPARYKGAYGGRAAGKSHFFAELAVEAMTADPNLSVVCIREVQRSLKYSVKSLVEQKIARHGVRDCFRIMETEIRRRGGSGIMIFEGMQDRTADSIKSLEGFDRAWVEEAQNLSARSLDLLLPTIRTPGSEIWFSWNPDQPTDPVDAFFRQRPPDNAVSVRAVYRDNPWCGRESRELAARWRSVDPETYPHVWLGEYNVRSNAIVLAGKWRIDEFEPEPDWAGPYYGADWGFAHNPTTLIRCWIVGDRLLIEHETGGAQWDNDETARRWAAVPGARSHLIRADAARPETIREMCRRGYRVTAAEKWPGSVEDGIQFLRSFQEIIIHARCRQTQEEARLWRYKTDRLTGDPLPRLQDGHEHYWDAIRYALAPLIRRRGAPVLSADVVGRAVHATRPSPHLIR